MQICLRSFGCSANTADAEILAGCLRSAGFNLAESELSADLVIYNTCAVKGPTENRIIDALKRVPNDKKLIVAGCLPSISLERILKEVRFDAAVSPAIGEEIVNVVKRVWEGEHIVELNYALNSKPQLDLPHIQSNDIVSIVPINYGCVGSCSYCCVVHARGRLRSCSVEEVVNRVRRDVKAGAKEVWITSQDVACYGKDIGTNLAVLLKSVALVEGDFRIRVGMMTPNLVVPFLSELIEAFECDKVFKFAHLPVQSGDDEVLRRMRRLYSAQEFMDVVAAFRNAFPKLTLSTDVICGFPGEDADAFKRTLDLISDVRPDVVNVSKFFARPKTEAWNMRSDAVDRAEVSRRSAETAKLAKQVALERNLSWIGWSGDILVDEKGKTMDSWVGRNSAYKPVAIKSHEMLLGKNVKVKVVKAFSTHLASVVV